MEELDKSKDELLVIGTPSYPNLTLEKLKEIIEEVYNQPRIKNEFDWIERMYQNMSPENKKLFNEALRQQAGLKVLPKIHEDSVIPKYIKYTIPTPNHINGFNKQINNKTKVTNRIIKKKKRKR